jgi:hypothetical protein
VLVRKAWIMVIVTREAHLERYMLGDLSAWNRQKGYWQTI